MTPPPTYFKRYRMEVELADRAFPVPALPPGFAWAAWEDRLLDAHAEAKHRSFRDETDAAIFPSLATPHGCRDLMRAIRARPEFLPAATWLLVGPDGPAGTVQGLRDRAGCGAVQNLGVVPGCRGLGLGAALLAKALLGFRAAGLKRAALEVTARNDAAVRLYRRFGFRSLRTIYKQAPATVPDPVGMGI